MPETAASAATVTWRAGSDRVAHASLPKALRTVCGMEIVAERLSWPAFRKCLACRAALEDVPEGEARLLWGGR